jgi:hypothetical protein
MRRPGVPPPSPPQPRAPSAAEARNAERLGLWKAARAALSQPAPALEAALAAAGRRGSPAVLALLAYGGHGLLRTAIKGRRSAALAPLVLAYGGGTPDAGLKHVLASDLDAGGSLLDLACCQGDAAAVKAVTRMCRRTGGRLAQALDGALARRCSSALAADAGAPGGPEAARLLLAELGPPGSALVLKFLAEDGHLLLLNACGSRGQRGAAAAVVEAYGPPGGSAVLGALAAGDHAALNAAAQYGSPEALAAVLRGYGPAGGPVVRAALERGRRGYAHGGEFYGRGGGNAHVLHGCIHDAFSFSRRTHDANAKLPLLLAALGEGPDHPTALRALDEVLEAFKRFEKINWLITVPKDSPLARLALLSPAAWAMGGAGTARTLLSLPVLAALQAESAAALAALPVAVFDPVGAYFRARPWLSFSIASDVPATLPPESGAALAAAGSRGIFG